MIWSPKAGPIFQLGRLQHFLGAVLLVAFQSRYSEAAGTLAAVLIVGSVWEVITKKIAKFAGWRHPFGDMIDLMAFALGAVVGGAIWLLR